MCLNVTARIGVLGQASVMSQKTFPGRVSVIAAAGFGKPLYVAVPTTVKIGGVVLFVLWRLSDGFSLSQGYVWHRPGRRHSRPVAFAAP
jgi:hypothetical protein